MEAVVRTLATAGWIAITVMIATWVFLAALQTHLPRWLVIPSAGVLAVMVVLEVKSRDLEQPDTAG